MNRLEIRSVNFHTGLIDGFKFALVAEIRFDGIAGEVTLASHDESSYDVWGDGPHCWCSSELVHKLSKQRLRALMNALQDIGC